MTDTIRIYIQRWLYERGNYQIIVENGANLGGYSQERITVNGVRVRHRIDIRYPLLFFKTVFEDTILDSTGELNIKVQWKSGLMNIHSRLLIEEKKQSWTDNLNIIWEGAKGEWPEPAEYETYR